MKLRKGPPFLVRSVPDCLDLRIITLIAKPMFLDELDKPVNCLHSVVMCLSCRGTHLIEEIDIIFSDVPKTISKSTKLGIEPINTLEGNLFPE